MKRDEQTHKLSGLKASTSVVRSVGSSEEELDAADITSTGQLSPDSSTSDYMMSDDVIITRIVPGRGGSGLGGGADLVGKGGASREDQLKIDLVIYKSFIPLFEGLKSSIRSPFS